jgi:hypothetical protein
MHHGCQKGTEPSHILEKDEKNLEIVTDVDVDVDVNRHNLRIL